MKKDNREPFNSAPVTANHPIHVLLVGVDNHSHQYIGRPGGDGCPTELNLFLRRLCVVHKPDLLAEELSEENVAEFGEASVVRVLAQEHSLPHVFCDPNDAERKLLKIPDYGRVLMFQFAGDRRRADDYMTDFWPIRELEWLKRIEASGVKRCLLVVGARHVTTLPVRARERAMLLTVLCERWTPEK